VPLISYSYSCSITLTTVSVGSTSSLTVLQSWTKWFLDVDVHLLVTLALAGNVLRADDFLEPCCVPFPCTVLRQGVFFYTVQLFAILLMATLGFDIIYSSN
jgi:hypothetical protein